MSLNSDPQAVMLRRGTSIAPTILQNAAAADGNGTSLDVRGFANVLVEVTGTFSATVNFEGSTDDSAWYALQGVSVTTPLVSVTLTTTTGAFRVPVSGFRSFRARISSYASGNVTVSATPSPFHSQNFIGVVVSNSSVGVIGITPHDQSISSSNPLIIGGRSSAAVPTSVSADDECVWAWYLRNGAQATVLTAAGALIGGDATNGLDVDVTRVPTDPFGANADAASATGSISAKLRFIAATGIPVTALPNVTLAAGTNTNEVVGDIAHDTGVGGNPVLIAGAAQDMDDTAPPNRVNAESDTTRFATDRDGAQFVHPHGPQIWSYHENSSSALTDTTVHASPGAGLSLYVTDIVFSTGSATACNIFFEEGASTVLGPYYLEAIAGRGLAIHFNTPKKITAATALTVTTSAAIAHSIDVTGFVGQG